MIAPTHIITAQTAYLAASVATGHSPVLAEAFTAAACGLLPDLDKRQGIIGRLFPMISEPLEYHIGHRTLTHSLLFLGMLGLALWYALPFGWWLAVMAGTASHIFADILTPTGVELFWPSKARAVMPGNPRYRFEAMGWPELGFAVVMGAAAIPLLQLARAEEGTGGVIKSALGDIASARRDYDAQKGANAWSLRIKGRDNRSYGDIGGEYPVIGPWGESGFIVQADGAPRSVCGQESCDWYADHAVLVKGAEEATTTRTVNATTLSTLSLVEALRPLQEHGTVYLLGTLAAHFVRGRSRRSDLHRLGDQRAAGAVHFARTARKRGRHARDVVRRDPARDPRSAWPHPGLDRPQRAGVRSALPVPARGGAGGAATVPLAARRAARRGVRVRHHDGLGGLGR